MTYRRTETGKITRPLACENKAHLRLVTRFLPSLLVASTEPEVDHLSCVTFADGRYVLCDSDGPYYRTHEAPKTPAQAQRELVRVISLLEERVI